MAWLAALSLAVGGASPGRVSADGDVAATEVPVVAAVDVPGGPPAGDRFAELRRLQAELFRVRAGVLDINGTMRAAQAAVQEKQARFEARLGTLPELEALRAARAAAQAELAGIERAWAALPVSTNPPLCVHAGAAAHAHAEDEPPDVRARRTQLATDRTEALTKLALANRKLETAAADARRSDPELGQLAAEIIEAQHLQAAAANATPEVTALQARIDTLRMALAAERVQTNAAAASPPEQP